MKNNQIKRRRGKLNKILFFVLFIMIVCLIAVLAIRMLRDTDSVKEQQRTEERKQEKPSENTQDSSSLEKSPEAIPEPQRVIPQENETGEEREYTKKYIEAKVKEIRNYYYATQECLPSLRVQNTGQYKYYINDAGKAEKVDFIMSDIGHNASYYYHDDELYFVFVWKGNHENRFYIEEGKILRWIDAEKNVTDIGTANDEYLRWESLIFGKNNLPY